MIINDTHYAICPVYNRKVTLNVGYNKEKMSKNDIGFTYKYVGLNCDFIREGKRCGYVECPLVETLDLRHCILE